MSVTQITSTDEVYSEQEIHNITDDAIKEEKLNFNLKLIVSRDVMCRSVFSESATDVFSEDKQSRLDGIAMWISEGDLLNYSGDPTIFKPTDSEITVVRVRQRGMRNKPKENKWNLNDAAIPGDGTHLGESPSLVNLATLVFPSKSTKNYMEDDEYLVPLSSWDPLDNPHKLSGSYSTDYIDDLNRLERDQTDKVFSESNAKIGLARKITNFLRKRCLQKRVRVFQWPLIKK